MANRLITYLSGARAEFRQVTWPTRETAIRLSLAVIVIAVVLAAFLGALDYAFLYLLRQAI